MTRKAPGATEAYREFQIHCGRRAVTTTYSSSALQAGIDYLRSLGSRADERDDGSGPTPSLIVGPVVKQPKPHEFMQV